MPTLITHAFVGASLTVLRQRSISPLKFAVIAATLAVLPDFDVLGFRHGIAYSDWLGHRGLTHSLPFAAVIGVLASLLFVRQVKLFSGQHWVLAFLLFVATASHGVLDSLTNAGLGVGFLIPFDDTRYFAPWRPLTASPLSISRFLDGSGATIMANEMRWVWAPIAVFIVIGIAARRKLSGTGT